MVQVYRTDHVGSLLRPKKLIDARYAHFDGKLSLAELRAVENAAIDDVVAMQRAAGIEVVSDGEFRRMSWMASPYAYLGGLQRDNTSLFNTGRLWHGSHEAEEEANRETPVDWAIAVDKLYLKERLTGAETSFLKTHSRGPYKITMPGPTILLPLFRPGASERAYKNAQALLDDLVRLYQTEVDAQLADGASYIQLDSLRYAQALGNFSPAAHDDVSDTAAVLRQAIASDNAVLSRAKGKAVRAIHICRGNHRSAWAMSGGYDSIAEQLFNECDTDRFLLEYDDERSGGFEPLRFMPKGKIAVLGIVSSKLPALEKVDDLCKRIDQASKYIPLDQLAISPQCGFASTHLGNLLTEGEERRKLELVVETARRIWG
jgi:5-methyltetrahydropteroyltriglutamate--homocysteine methyltransferase